MYALFFLVCATLGLTPEKLLRSRPGKPNQRKGQNEKFMNFAHFCEFWCFSLGKQARFTLNFCSGMPPGKVHELAFFLVRFAGATPELRHTCKQRRANCKQEACNQEAAQYLPRKSGLDSLFKEVWDFKVFWEGVQEYSRIPTSTKLSKSLGELPSVRDIFRRTLMTRT